MFLGMRMCMCICMCVCMYVCMHVCMYACVYVCIHVCMYVCMCVCMHACMPVCMYVRMHVCMFGPEVWRVFRYGSVRRLPFLRSGADPGRKTMLVYGAETFKVAQERRKIQIRSIYNIL